MAKNTSVVLGDHFDEMIAAQLESGRYASASEIIRTALRMFEERELRLASLRTELEAGLASGFKDFDPDADLAEMLESSTKNHCLCCVPLTTERAGRDRQQ